ncbi:Hypothetical_protein [Hexamita inflata]|uniref:Hypothetical_protein n=1 Tax=Hexamita inflata TaxID=28002 RepID=A0AA86NCG1_9EUKA|nr:Hypothetical protein HINF_LOCUS4793 [Hexamita inflata]CAI9917149.1 Hypothetical protein HINF_LOCUS4794 [Hexamita inflata]
MHGMRYFVLIEHFRTQIQCNQLMCSDNQPTRSLYFTQRPQSFLVWILALGFSYIFDSLNRFPTVYIYFCQKSTKLQYQSLNTSLSHTIKFGSEYTNNIIMPVCLGCLILYLSLIKDQKSIQMLKLQLSNCTRPVASIFSSRLFLYL